MQQQDNLKDVSKSMSYLRVNQHISQSPFAYKYCKINAHPWSIPPSSEKVAAPGCFDTGSDPSTKYLGIVGTCAKYGDKSVSECFGS